MGPEWLLPVAKGAYENRKEILSAWERISAWLAKKKSIAFTGMAGVGKTVLVDHLTGTAYKRGYTLPLRSESLEKGKLSATKKRIGFSVLPGQESTPRFEGLNQLFSDKKAVDGVVHVVANGFIEIREAAARQRLAQKGLDTLEKYREHQFKEELKDLNATCDLVRQSIRKHQKPTWMLVAVTKADLFYNDITSAQTYYSLGGNSTFVERLNQLQTQVGTDNFRWEALPVCSCLEDFEWNGENQASTLKPQQRDHFIARFAKYLEHYCE